MKINYVTKQPLTFAEAVGLLTRSGCTVENADDGTAVVKDCNGNAFTIRSAQTANQPNRVMGWCYEKDDPGAVPTALGMVSQFKEEYHKIAATCLGGSDARWAEDRNAATTKSGENTRGQTAPLHYTKRTVEDIEVGDDAWVSFDGKTALPAQVVEKDDRHYTVRFECGSSAFGVQRGGEHFFFLDEVRTTPVLACVNMVTW